MHIHQLDAEVLSAGRSELVQQIISAARLPQNAMLASLELRHLLSEFQIPICASYQ